MFNYIPSEEAVRHGVTPTQMGAVEQQPLVRDSSMQSSHILSLKGNVLVRSKGLKRE